MMKKFKSLIIILVLVMMFFPICTLAFGNYSESYKKTWGDNSKDYVRTITGNACQVSDGVVVLSLSPGSKNCISVQGAGRRWRNYVRDRKQCPVYAG